MATVVEHSRLKEFQGRLEKLKAEQAVILIRKKEVLKDEQDVNKKINYIKQEIKGLTKNTLTISEHGILQFQNRVQLLNSQDVIEYILTDELKKLYSILGDGKFPLKNNTHSAIIKNGVIVTIITA